MDNPNSPLMQERTYRIVEDRELSCSPQEHNASKVIGVGILAVLAMVGFLWWLLR